MLRYLKGQKWPKWCQKCHLSRLVTFLCFCMIPLVQLNTEHPLRQLNPPSLKPLFWHNQNRNAPPPPHTHTRTVEPTELSLPLAGTLQAVVIEIVPFQILWEEMELKIGKSATNLSARFFIFNHNNRDFEESSTVRIPGLQFKAVVLDAIQQLYGEARTIVFLTY